MNWLRYPLAVLANRTGRTPRRPGWVTYLVCFRCNARCRMCDSWRLKPGAEMTPDEVAVVFRKIGRLDIVRLSGGEPFLRADFADVAHAVWQESRPSVLHVTTNGSFPDRVVAFAEGFAAPRQLRFLVSFDGHAEEHDANRGKDVLFSTARETVRLLAGLRQPLGIGVSVNHTVISPQSMADHDRLVAEFAPLRVDVQAVLAYEDSAMYGYKRFGRKAHDLIQRPGYPLHPKLKGTDAAGFARRLLGDVHAISDRFVRWGKRYYLRGLLARLKGQASPRPHPPCTALRSHLRLLPDGSVPVCQFNTETIGNLLRQSFEEVWYGDAGRDARAWVGACPGCWAECEAMPSALYSGDIFLR